MTFTLSTTIDLPWAEALDHTRDALSAQGFGNLTEIDARSTFEAKLGAEAADAVGPQTMVQLSAAPAVQVIADDAANRLRKALTALSS
ncbi:hypothetical protein KNN17_08840 [Arthrobacter bambusae]|uniref:hypothetical protein n=1 Tax=Arthrobacter TaxID=1663 RepID=UPI001F509075|nr:MULTISPECIES: hypothetical protein [Arthrobacter]MCI0141681.1 hypothetical protein [Arthrobacter bambusae]UYY83176.1 hypothetical protein OIT41_09140 [Arthrobacter sp. YA7-1]